MGCELIDQLALDPAPCLDLEPASVRELGIIDDEQQARTLADYLLTLDIGTRIIPNRDGRFGVWVQREDHLDSARQAFDDFAHDPADERFQAAARTARSIRKRAEAIEAQHRKNTRDLRDRWEGAFYRRAQITAALFVACVAVFVLQKVEPYRTLYWLLFSLKAFDGDGHIVDLGFANIRQGEVWRLITPIFLHFGPYHIVFNMIAMIGIGQRIEVVKRRWKYLVFIVVAAILSNLGQYAVSGGGFGGMSGVLYAMAGYVFLKGYLAPEEGLSLSVQTAQIYYAWFLLGIFAPIIYPEGEGMIFNMGNMAHGVGLLVGVVFALLRF